MLSVQFVILGAVLNVAGSLDYVLDTVRGRCQPDVVTWTLWALPPCIGFAAGIAAGSGPQAMLTLSLTLGPVSVLLACAVSRNAHFAPATRLDRWCGALSVATIVVWAATRDAEIAIALSIATDALASLPTACKAYREPGSESPGAWGLFAVGGVITLLTIKDWSLATGGFPLYVTVLSSGFLLLIVIPHRRPHVAPA